MRQVLLQTEKTGLTPLELGRVKVKVGIGSRVDCNANTGSAIRPADQSSQGPAKGVLRLFFGAKCGSGPEDQKTARHAKITFYSNRCCGMRTMLSILRSV